MGILDTIFQVNAPRNASNLADLEYAQQDDRQKAGGLIQLRDKSRIEAINRLSDENSVINNSYFGGDAEKYKEWKKGFDSRTSIKSGNPQNALVASDILKLSGSEEYYKYLNNSGLSGSYLGPGKRIDGVNTGIDFSTESLINPTVRAVDPNTGRVYSAQATYGGENVRDIFQERGAEGVGEAAIDTIPLSFIDELDEEYGNAIQGRSGGDLRLGYLQGGAGANRAVSDLEVRKRFDEEEANIARLEETAGIIETQDKELTNEQGLQDKAAREARARENFGFLSFTGDFSGFSDARDPLVGEDVKTLKRGGDITSQLFDGPNPPVTETGMDLANYDVDQNWLNENNLNDYTYIPGSEPFDMGENAFNNLSDNDKERMVKLAKTVSQKNFLRKGGAAAQESGETYRRLAKDGVIKGDSPTARADADAAQKFYDAQGVSQLFTQEFKNAAPNKLEADLANVMSSKLMKRLQERPDLMKEFEADPTAFALKYQNNTKELYGPAKNVAALNKAVRNIDKSGANITDAQKAIANRDSVALRAEIAKMKATSDSDQQMFANYIEQTGGDFGRLDKKARTSLYLNILASIPADGALFQTLTAGDTMGNMVESGVFNFNELNARTDSQRVENTRLAAEQTRREGFDVTLEVDKLSKLMFKSEDDGGGLKSLTSGSLDEANFIINTTLSNLANAAKEGPLSSTNKQALNTVMEARARQLKEYAKEKSDPDIIDMVLSLFSDKPAAQQFFENMANIDVTDKTGAPITSVEQWLTMSPEDRKKVRIYEGTSNTELSPSDLTNTFGQGTVESLIFTSLQ